MSNDANDDSLNKFSSQENVHKRIEQISKITKDKAATDGECDKLCIQEMTLDETIEKFNTHLDQFNENFVKFLKNRETNTNMTKHYYNKMRNNEIEINKILSELREFNSTFNDVVSNNTTFLHEQNGLITSKRNQYNKNNLDIINNNKKIKSKELTYKNSDKLLKISKDKIRYYTHINIVLGSVLLIMIIYFSLKIIKHLKKKTMI